MAAASAATAVTEFAGSIPVPTTSLLGREREQREISKLLAADATRVVTLLGPGGVGKTRLAIAVAAELESADPGSVLFVTAAHERSRAGMMIEIATAFGVRDQPGNTVLELIAAASRDSVSLLVVDNLEQIPEAGVDLGELLRAVPGLTLLATSRAPLRISGEQHYRVDPLPVETGDETSEAVRLFTARAGLVGPFTLTDSNRRVATDICRRLDGLPLAIELAAVRLRTLSPEALLARLTNRLTLLGSGPVDAPQRQQTLQTAIAWSYDLLAPDEKRAFRRLTSIPAGFTLELAAAVLELDDALALSVIDALVDQSLFFTLPTEEGEIRFGVLQTIRDFGLERANVDGDFEQARSALANHVHGLSGTIRAGLEGGEEPAWRAWCARERPNVAAAIDWFVEEANAAAAVATANAYWRFWYYGGHYREGIATLERVLTHATGVPEIDLARAYNGLGALYFGLDMDAPAAAAFDRATVLWEAANDLIGLANTTNNRALLAQTRGDLSAAIVGFERAIEIVTALGDARRLASAQDNLGMTLEAAGQHERAAELHARALATSRSIDDEQLMASSLRHLASALASLGDVDGAIDRAEDSRKLWERLGVRNQLAYTLNTLGTLLDKKGDANGAEQRYELALAIWEELEEPRGISLGLHNRAACAIARGELALALELLRRSLTIRRAGGNPIDLSFSFAGFAEIALASGDPERATRLLAFSRILLKSAGVEQSDRDDRSKARRALGKARFDAAWKTGSAMSLVDAVVETERISVSASGAATPSLRDTAISLAPAPISSAKTRDHGLTERELDVLRLVATGKTNADIGEALFISPFTAKTHVANLLGKLGVESRAAASTWAAQHDLL